MRGSITQLPNTPSWRGTQFKERTRDKDKDGTNRPLTTGTSIFVAKACEAGYISNKKSDLYSDV